MESNRAVDDFCEDLKNWRAGQGDVIPLEFYLESVDFPSDPDRVQTKESTALAILLEFLGESPATLAQLKAGYFSSHTDLLETIWTRLPPAQRVPSVVAGHTLKSPSQRQECVWTTETPSVLVKLAFSTTQRAALANEIYIMTTLGERRIGRRFISEVYAVVCHRDYMAATISESGDDLAQLIELSVTQGRTIGAVRITWIVYRLASALRLLHGRGIVHRNITPANISLATNSSAFMPANVSIVNFDSAIDTSRGFFVSQHFALPEPESEDQQHLSRQLQNNDAQVDVYSAGVVLYQLLCLTLPPKENGDPMGLTEDIDFAIVESRLLRLRNRLGLTGHLTRVCLRAMNPDPTSNVCDGNSLFRAILLPVRILIFHISLAFIVYCAWPESEVPEWLATLSAEQGFDLTSFKATDFDVSVKLGETADISALLKWSETDIRRELGPILRVAFNRNRKLPLSVEVRVGEGAWKRILFARKQALYLPSGYPKTSFYERFTTLDPDDVSSNGPMQLRLMARQHQGVRGSEEYCVCQFDYPVDFDMATEAAYAELIQLQKRIVEDHSILIFHADRGWEVSSDVVCKYRHCIESIHVGTSPDDLPSEISFQQQCRVPNDFRSKYRAGSFPRFIYANSDIALRDYVTNQELFIKVKWADGSRSKCLRAKVYE